jgi:hypothetical protein
MTITGSNARRIRPTCIFANGLFLKERCIEMFQHIYEKPFLERNECPLSILRMVYAEVLLGKMVDLMTINIQSKSNMKAPLTSFFGLGRKFLHGGLGKKMPSIEIPNDMVVHSATSSDDEKVVVLELRGVQYWPASRGRWYTTPSPRWLPMRPQKNHFFSKPLRGRIMDMERKGRVLDPQWMTVTLTWRPSIILLKRLRNWNKNWQL